MKVTRAEVESFYRRNIHLKDRKHKYEVMSLMTGVPSHLCQRIVNINRRIQDIVPNDEKGKAMAEQYQYEEGYMSQDTSKQYILRNGIKYKIVSG